MELNLSVPVSKRKQSDLECIKNALTLRFELTKFLLTNFGVNVNGPRKVSFTVKCLKNISQEDQETITKLAQKYGDSNPVLLEYPIWILKHFRVNILELMRKMIQNIIGANTIYVIYPEEYFERRKLQTAAIINCEQLLQELYYTMEILPTDANKYMQYIQLIEKEIKLLKGWRKSDNRLLKEMKNGKRLPEQKPKSETEVKQESTEKEPAQTYENILKENLA